MSVPRLKKVAMQMQLLHGSVVGILTGIVFGMTMILLYVMSATQIGRASCRERV